MMFGWYEPEIKGYRLFLLRVGTVCGLVGTLCLIIVAVVSLIGMFAA